MQGAGIRSLVMELRSCMLHGVAKKKKKGRKERVGGKRWENTKKKVKEKREFMIIKVGKKQKKNNKNLAKKG